MRQFSLRSALPADPKIAQRERVSLSSATDSARESSLGTRITRTLPLVERNS